MPKTTSTTDLRGYALVADRIAEFYAAFPNGQILTEIIARDQHETVIRASIYRAPGDSRPSATGLAAEREGDGDINTVACLENTETSAIGRALANLGFLASRHRPSREEIQQAARARSGASSATSQGTAAADATSRTEAATNGPVVGRVAQSGYDEGMVRAVHERPPVPAPDDNLLQAQADALTDCLRLLERAARAGLPPDKALRLRRRLIQSRSLAPSELARIEHRLRDWIASTAGEAHAPATRPE